MSCLAFLLIAAPAHLAGPGDQVTLKPEEALFARAMVVGADISDGFGLEKELGAPGSLADVVLASLLFEPKKPIELHVFAETSVAPQQIKAALDGSASIVIALDYLIPYVYATAQGDDARRAQVDAALKALEPLKCPIVLGDVPDLRVALALEKPTLGAGQVPSVEALKALNESIATWAFAHKNVSLAPVALVFARVQANESFHVRTFTWPQSWLPDLVQADKIHTRLHGTIALWLAGLDVMCAAHPELDPNAFDWNALSIHKKVYAAKAKARDAAVQKEIAKRRLLPTRPPPSPPPPPPTEEESKKARERKAGGGEDKSGG